MNTNEMKGAEVDMNDEYQFLADLAYITAVWAVRVMVGCLIGGVGGWMLWITICQDDKELSAGKSPHSGWVPAEEEKEPLSHDMSSTTIINQ